MWWCNAGALMSECVQYTSRNPVILKVVFVVRIKDCIKMQCEPMARNPAEIWANKYQPSVTLCSCDVCQTCHNVLETTHTLTGRFLNALPFWGLLFVFFPLTMTHIHTGLLQTPIMAISHIISSICNSI